MPRLHEPARPPSCRLSPSGASLSSFLSFGSRLLENENPTAPGMFRNGLSERTVVPDDDSFLGRKHDQYPMSYVRLQPAGLGARSEGNSDLVGWI